MKQRILVADDEPLYLQTTGELLRRSGFECVCVTDAHQAIQKLREQEFDLVLSDLNMPGNFKLELLREQAKLPRRVPIIVVTGVPSLPSAIESIRLGIFDYLLKPIRFEDLLSSVKRALNSPPSARAELTPRQDSEWSTLFPEIIGCSPVMLEVFEIIDRVSSTDTNILITGESGTGKEVVAKAIHSHSHRSAGNFQVIDCTAIPDSLFESMLFGHKKGAFTGATQDQPGLLKQCDGGTAFFDELGELPLTLQAKLLRAVQEQTFIPVGSHTPVDVNTRFICATNRDLQMEVNAGRFRQDLFYRLGVIQIELPPLRKRGDDVILLANDFLKRLSTTKTAITGFSDDAIDAIYSYAWPGNIRELRNVIERTIALTSGPIIRACDLPKSIVQRNDFPHDSSVSGQHVFSQAEQSAGIANYDLQSLAVPADASRDEALRIAEHQYLARLMHTHQGNVSEAARQAGLSRQGLHKLLKSHNLRADDYR